MKKVVFVSFWSLAAALLLVAKTQGWAPPARPTPLRRTTLSSREIFPISSSSIRLSSSLDDAVPEDMSSGINVGLIGQSLANQILIGLTIWTGGSGYEVLSEQANFGPVGIVLGLCLGALPLIALSRQIETSDSYLLSGLNLSTNMAVLRLFGPNPQPILALIISLLLAGVTGIVEEVTFRGQLTSFFANRLLDGDVLIGAAMSTFLFAFLHTNPASFFKGDPEQLLDNVVLLLLQLVNGSWFAIVYLTTGNLAVSIVAHACYDFYTFYKTHMVDVAGQMDYAKTQTNRQESNSHSSSSSSIVQKWTEKRGRAFVQQAQQAFYMMDTNRDGVLSLRELRIALFAYGVNLSPQQTKRVAQTADLDASGNIDMLEFLEFVGPTGSTGKAVRNSIFGPL